MNRFETLLLPFDLSDRARPAMEQATRIAEKLGARLLLLHVEIDEGGGYEGGETPGEQEAYEVEELVHLAHSGAPHAPTEFFTRRGEPAAQIVEFCGERQVDLIVLPTRDPGPPGRFAEGSTTAQVLRRAPCPVLTGAGIGRPGDLPDFRRIACLVELKGDSKPLLAFSSRLARQFGAELTAIHIAPAFSLDLEAGADFLGSLRASTRLRLERILEEARVAARVVVSNGALEERLPVELESRKTGLLILSRNPAAPPDGPPSLSAQACAAIRAAPCPVLSL